MLNVGVEKFKTVMVIKSTIWEGQDSLENLKK
jgi:hypothetical protein